MKAFFSALLLCSLLAPFANAFETCGTLERQYVYPTCNPGQMCSHMVRVQNVLLNTGSTVLLQTDSSEVLSKFNEYQNQLVCVIGFPYAGGINVTEVNQALSAY